jgi:hypothetical protein
MATSGGCFSTALAEASARCPPRRPHASPAGVARGSIRRRGAGRIRRTGTASSGSTSLATCRLASSISAELICSKSFDLKIRHPKRSFSRRGLLFLALVGAASAVVVQALRRRGAAPPGASHPACPAPGIIACHHPLDQSAATPENGESLIENRGMLAFFDENRVQRGAKIGFMADARRLHRRHRLDHRAGPDRQPRHPQRAAK